MAELAERGGGPVAPVAKVVLAALRGALEA